MSAAFNPPDGASAPRQAISASARVDEQPIVFGPERNLMGILSRPADGGSADVACLMLNMGVTHRIGPHRINVKLARELARRGITSLRFDLSGIGDSAPSRRPADYRTQGVRDVQAAMDAITAATGLQRFVVFGLCSGAMHAHAVGLADPRVVGLYMFDGYAYTTRRVRWSRNWHRLLAMPRNPAIAGKTGRWLRRAFRRDRAPTVDIFADDGGPNPTASDFAEQLESMHRRGVRLLLAYSATLHAVDHGHDQLSALGDHPVLGHLRYEFMPEVDHTLLPLSAQRQLIASVSDWIGREWGCSAVSVAKSDPTEATAATPESRCATHDH